MEVERRGCLGSGCGTTLVRGDGVFVSPTPDFRFQAGDRLIVVGTRDGVHAAHALLTSR
jgi:K+/H+ antiporter YhaU regulatory subunit KhtT